MQGSRRRSSRRRSSCRSNGMDHPTNSVGEATMENNGGLSLNHTSPNSQEPLPPLTNALDVQEGSSNSSNSSNSNNSNNSSNNSNSSNIRNNNNDNNDDILSRSELEELKTLLQDYRQKGTAATSMASSASASTTVIGLQTGIAAADTRSGTTLDLLLTDSHHHPDTVKEHGDDHEHTHLSEDTFSFLIAARMRSAPFCTGIVVVVIKTTMYSLILADMLEKGSPPSNPLGIAASLEWQVATTQTLAVAITVITQDDLITALQLIHSGYGGIGVAFEYSSFPKWFSSTLILFWVGLYGLLVTFLLIITSNDVIELILNFTAIEFISLLDNIVFSLSSNGFFGQSNRLVARMVQNTSYPQSRSAKNVPWLQIVLLTLSFLGMLCGLIGVFIIQANGRFLPPHLIVQFDDDVIPSLGTYSGFFSLQVRDGNLWSKERVSYHNPIGDGTIGYCSELEAWTFGAHGRTNFCDGIMALSENPTTTDISLILGRPWYVRLGMDSERLLPMENAFCATACDSDLECGGREQGACSHGRCICQEGYFGLRCNYVQKQICDTFRVDELTEEFTGLRRKVASEYSILRNEEGELVSVYGHPVYIDSYADEKRPGEAVDVILYTGLRWMLSFIVPPVDGSGMHTLFGEFFHANSTTLISIQAVTETVPFNTATDERPAPIGVEWFLPGAQVIAEMEPIISINTVLVCSKCGEYNPCSFGSVCGSGGKCICDRGETGSLCQVIPVGDGHCDNYFNEQEFGYDGGDCCEASCQSSASHQCGVVAEGVLDSIPVGFPFCADPEYGCLNGESDCWSKRSDGIPLLIKKSSGAFVKLSSNGRTIIISEPELDTIRVFDQVDKGWVQRGQALEGEATSRFGTLVAISTLPGNVVRRRTGRVPVVIAVAAVGPVTNYVEVYSFDPHGTIWQREGPPIRFDETVDSLDLGSSGAEIVVAVGLRNSNRAYLYKQDKALNWKVALNTTGSSVGVSGDGKTLVCISTNPPPESAGSGIFSIANLSLPDPYDVGIVNNMSLPNLLPFGTYSFAFQSRPVQIKMSYDAAVGVTWGQVFPGSYGLNGLSMIGLTRGNPEYITDRLAEVGYDVSEEMPENQRPFFDISSDTTHFAINSHGTEIEIFNIESVNGFFDSFRLHPNSSSLPKFSVNGFENRFALSSKATVMAIVLGDRVKVVQRSSSCDGTSLRLAITLDELPGSVSWSLDFVGQMWNETLPTENIARCDKCYDRDPRYTRVVVVEDFCIPTDKVGCVQLSFRVEGRHLGDGAGFIALQNGTAFASYKGERETRAPVIPGGCPSKCPDGTHKFDMLMRFEPGLFPTSLESPLGPIWSASTNPLPGIEGDVLIRKCLFGNNTGSFELVGSGGTGTVDIIIDNSLVLKQTFDIGGSQIFNVSFDENNKVQINTPALCQQSSCPHCDICPTGMIVGQGKVDIAGFHNIQCSVLSSLAENGINPSFCALYPVDIGSLCNCRHIGCPENQVSMRLEIEFDKHPEDIVVQVLDKSGATVWNLDFEDYVLTEEAKPTFESCVPIDGPLYFRISDRNQDGLCCSTDSGFFLPSGSRGYDVYIDGELVGSREFPFGSGQELIFRAGVNTSVPEVSQPRIWCPDCSPCPVCPGGEFNRSSYIVFGTYGTINCFDYAVNMSNYIDTDYCSFFRDHIAESCGCQVP